MSIPTATHPRPHLSRRVDQASVALLRSVMSDHWHPHEAARELLTHVRDDLRVIRLLKGRVSRVMLERPTRIAERAAITLDLALSTPVEHRADLFPAPCPGRTA